MVPKLVPKEHENEPKNPDSVPININSDDIQTLTEQLSKLSSKERAELMRLLQGDLFPDSIQAENI